MRPFGRGILPSSQIYLYDLPEEEKSIFLYPLCTGHYQCSRDYVIHRQSYDSFLMLYVVSGDIWISQDGATTGIPAGHFGLLDCFRPHTYGSHSGCEMYWVHFDGPAARAYFDRIFQRKNLLPVHFDRARRSIMELSSRSEEKEGLLLSAPEAHRLLTNLLMEFMADSDPRIDAGEEAMEAVRNYILENAAQDLDLDALAAQARLSPFHFSRQFKRYVGMTPHAFLIHTRLSAARFYLVSSDMTVKEIGLSCGFSSESAFCTCFKKHTGVTPSDFRSAPLSAG